jgi:phage baseplate assembly protein W
MSTPKLKRFYKGFDTATYEEKGGSFDVYDVECVERDLLREIFTVKGERIYMPDYGTRIPLMIFEMNDQESADVIRGDLEMVFSHDPRVQLLNLDIVQARDKNAVVAIAKVNYKEFAITRDLWIEINSQ